jgi:hypothetical protein
MLGTWVSGLIEVVKLRGPATTGEAWSPGKKLKLLLAGYNGARNTGEEVRVEEIVRQFLRVLGPLFSRHFCTARFPGMTEL